MDLAVFSGHIELNAAASASATDAAAAAAELDLLYI